METKLTCSTEQIYDTVYTEYTDHQDNTFIYEDGELTSIILPNGYHIHIYSDGEPEIQEQD